jgi:molecular chaperone GrpE
MMRMRSWYDNEELLRRFREWLARSDAEIYAFSQERAELPRDAGDDDLPDDDPPDDDLPEVGLLQLIESFTALRQELKLQTKGARGLEENVQQALAGLVEATEQLHTVEAREAESVERASRPLVEALIELDEALERGLRSAQATQQQMVEDALGRYEQAAQQRLNRLSAWQRWKARAWWDQARDLFREQTLELHRRMMLPLLEGYQLIYDRLERTLSQLRIQRIDCLGRPVDPTRMTVVELVDSDAEPETVVGLVRPGYQWHGRLIRYAEVRAARRAETADLNNLT